MWTDLIVILQPLPGEHLRLRQCQNTPAVQESHYEDAVEVLDKLILRSTWLLIMAHSVGIYIYKGCLYQVAVFIECDFLPSTSNEVYCLISIHIRIAGTSELDRRREKASNISIRMALGIMHELVVLIAQTVSIFSKHNSVPINFVGMERNNCQEWIPFRHSCPYSRGKQNHRHWKKIQTGFSKVPHNLTLSAYHRLWRDCCLLLQSQQ